MVSIFTFSNSIETRAEKVNNKNMLNDSTQIHNKLKASESSGVSIEFDKKYGFVPHKNNIVISFKLMLIC